jgi:hypothetical protein
MSRFKKLKAKFRALMDIRPVVSGKSHFPQNDAGLKLKQQHMSYYKCGWIRVTLRLHWAAAGRRKNTVA